mmetsp:Transcript_57404/g.113145  ORF Transcript_57404/g.113145 Transcript_57404/m.113145 type:complete len:235 (+) Transcript_57404:168-872(+)
MVIMVFLQRQQQLYSVAVPAQASALIHFAELTHPTQCTAAAAAAAAISITYQTRSTPYNFPRRHQECPMLPQNNHQHQQCGLKQCIYISHNARNARSSKLRCRLDALPPLDTLPTTVDTHVGTQRSADTATPLLPPLPLTPRLLPLPPSPLPPLPRGVPPLPWRQRSVLELLSMVAVASFSSSSTAPLLSVDCSIWCFDPPHHYPAARSTTKSLSPSLLLRHDRHSHLYFPLAR